MKKIAILGSGASAISAALFFFENEHLNLEIDVIDFGLRPTPSSSQSPTVSRLKSSSEDYLFQLPEIFGFAQNGSTPSGTAAFGGWAEAWGATILAYSDEELKNLGINLSDFRKSFSKIVDFISPSFDQNDLNRKISPFLLSLLIRKDQNQFSLSRLAISRLSSDPKVGCNQCGKCLSGCDFGHIWKPSNSWPTVFSDSRFQYQGGLWIDQIFERDSKIEIAVKSPKGVTENRIYDYVFCGLGPFQTAALMLRSQISNRVELRDSQMMLIPFCGKRFEKTGGYENRIALSEAFLTNRNLNSTPLGKSIFAQIYVDSISLQETFVKYSPFIRRIPGPMRKFLLARLGVAMTFYDQEISSSMILTYNLDGITLKEDSSRLNLRTASAIARDSLGNCGLRSLGLFSRVVKTGEGYHSGASFPMQSNSGQNSSDQLGRPNGLKHFSIIDSSVLPRITSTPPTVNTMANAHRIARDVSKQYLSLG